MTSRSDFFDQRAENWEQAHYPGPVRERLQKLIQTFGVTPGETILDVGTGPGILIPYLEPLAGISGRVFAFDLSFPMVGQARRKTRADNDLVVQANVLEIPFGTGIFHRVICFAAFPHFEDPAIALQEMGRVLKPGGYLVIAHLMSRRELAAHHASHTGVEKDLLPHARQMAGLFLAAGFQEPEIKDMPGRYTAVARK
ncbi:class I SAM-dependent methyltransferase [Desulfotignum balticum]|uniref:Methyltransferase n=1 Tax=Desulfotignum balticum TaxID=115781 RepID=B2DD75_9BACT|nr:class I SAM-dependent methyltransferase [Desulfotignum balticum]BAG28264.1 methyltransferase [Desulfotignum balticum]